MCFGGLVADGCRASGGLGGIAIDGTLASWRVSMIQLTKLNLPCRESRNVYSLFSNIKPTQIVKVRTKKKGGVMTLFFSILQRLILFFIFNDQMWK